MKAIPICHPDFADLAPLNVWHKEHAAYEQPHHPEQLKNRHILFRKKFVLPRFDAKTSRAVMRITADDYYKLRINGMAVTQGPAPAYPSAYYYNEVDVTEYLREGENVISVHQYYQGLVNRVWVSADLRSMIWAELEVDGEIVLATDETWKCAVHTGYTPLGLIGYETQYCEQYDSRAPEVNFHRTDFDDLDWGYARFMKHGDYTFVKQPTEQLAFEGAYPVKRENLPGCIRVDFGQEMVGTLTITGVGNPGDCVTIRYGEELNEDGTVRYEMRCNCRYEDKWILSGGADWFIPYDYKAFRYAEILYPETAQIHLIQMAVRHYPYEKRASYTNVPDEMGDILTLCENTIKYGMQECFVDCPTREKGQYSGDVSISGRSHAILTGDTAMMKKAIREFCHSAFICEGLMAVSNGSLMQEIADYSLQMPAQACFVYALDHDLDFLREIEPAMTGVYRYFRRYMRTDGLIEGVKDKWNLVDWPANLRDGYDFPLPKPIGDGVHNVLNALWCGFLDAMDELYTNLGMPVTGEADRVKSAFVKEFYNPDTGLYCDSGTLTHSAAHSGILPLLFDIGTQDEARKQRLIDFIMEKRLTSVGVYMAYFALAALVKHGRRDLAIQLTLDEGCWKNMLKEGATTTYEAWGKDQKWNTSLFHPWATAPLIVFADGTRIY